MSNFGSLSRPMRLAGALLIGVALAAVAIGTITTLTGGDAGDTAAPTSSATGGQPGAGETPTGAPTTTPPPATPPAPTTTSPSATTTAPTSVQPGTPPGQDGGVPGEQAAAKWVVLRVYNNSTIHGLAARAADDFRKQGWNVAEASNYPYGIIRTTTAYYRPGTDEETAAKALAASFGMRVEPRFEGIQQASAGVIVIVTNDYQGIQGKN